MLGSSAVWFSVEGGVQAGLIGVDGAAGAGDGVGVLGDGVVTVTQELAVSTTERMRIKKMAKCFRFILFIATFIVASGEN